MENIPCDLIHLFAFSFFRFLSDSWSFCFAFYGYKSYFVIALDEQANMPFLCKREHRVFSIKTCRKKLIFLFSINIWTNSKNKRKPINTVYIMSGSVSDRTYLYLYILFFFFLSFSLYRRIYPRVCIPTDDICSVSRRNNVRWLMMTDDNYSCTEKICSIVFLFHRWIINATSTNISQCS